MSAQKKLHFTIISLQRLQESVVVDGDIDTEYFDLLIQNIYEGEHWLTPELARTAKNAIDIIGFELRKSMKNLLIEGKNIPVFRRAKSAYRSNHHKRPIIGFDRNA